MCRLFGLKNKVLVIGTTSLNLAEFAFAAEEKDFDLTIPLTIPCGATEPRPSLHIQLSLMELRGDQEPLEATQSQSQTSETSSGEKDELSTLKAGLRKVKIFTEYVSTRRGKKTSREDDQESRSKEESLEGSEEGESNEVKEEEDDAAAFRKSFSYGTLAYANCSGGYLYEDGVYYSNQNHKSDQNDDSVSTTSVSEAYVVQNPKRSILP
uniref:Uncharacterized protein n=1 Tax=Lactuca sativa TaxID=4236 RepID=A0A9R1VM83_LACSA|nr:hypothetical protein LSAT_V11C400206930 [Lactuca sativa]